MSRKAILVCAAAAAALLAVVAVAVAVLYSGTGSGEETLDDSRYELLAAVPTDAVAVMRFESVGDMISLLADNSSVLNQFTGSYGQSSFVKFLSSLHDMSGHGALPLKSSPAVISFHYNGELVPLLVVDPRTLPEFIPCIRTVQEFCLRETACTGKVLLRHLRQRLWSHLRPVTFHEDCL